MTKKEFSDKGGVVEKGKQLCAVLIQEEEKHK